MASDGEISCTNDPNFAVIYSFLKVFGKLYSLEVPNIVKLQQLIENTQEVLDPLKELHLRLLRRALKSVQSTRWERGLIKFCHQQGFHQEAWEIERFSYKKASTTVKLKVLKLLLEYQFTCHPKFKAAINGVSPKELRLDPVGTDKNGCVYWLQVDDEANLCLYKEDQDEETWQLIARLSIKKYLHSDREELVKVISQLKCGEEICPSNPPNANEDSSSFDIPPQMESNKSEATDDENEEFLSPESESEHDEQSEESKPQDTVSDNECNNKEECTDTSKQTEDQEANSVTDDNIKVDHEIQYTETQKHEDTGTANEEAIDTITEIPIEEPEGPTDVTVEEKKETKETSNSVSTDIEKENESISEAIEEPVMVVTGEGNGADCECSFIIGEEIEEPIMYFFGDGYGYDNDTGNPEVVEQADTEDYSDEENANDECVNGEHTSEVSNSSSKSRLSKGIKLRSSLSVNRRSLKKQSSESTEVLKPDSKKHCVRDLNKSESSNSIITENDLKREGSIDNTDDENSSKNNVKKTRSKVKKKPKTRKLKLNEEKDTLNTVPEIDNGHDSKSSIIEKRKSSLSSEDHDDADGTENEKDKSPEKEIKADDQLPPKKLRLETTPESDNDVSHSKEKVDAIDNINIEDKHEKEELNTENVENEPVSHRKKIKANKGKFKRKKINKVVTESNKSNNRLSDIGSSEKKTSKSLKRSLLDANQSDKNRSESQTESEVDEPVTIGKRLKIKPKKIITSSRKKVEEKLKQNNTTDESEEETLYSIAGKKTPKKILKKKPKCKEKPKQAQEPSEDSELTPVRQSRRIAQMKIKEEADRRHMEEVALRELKMIHKKKSKDDGEEEWRDSGASSSEEDKRKRKVSQWRAADSTGPDNDTDSDEPLFEHPHTEPDLDFSKSDHEFSPESDLESGEPAEPLKLARTLQEGKDDGFCKRCGSGEQPEWILLCDQCDAGYHASCLKPLLLLIPEGDWYCPPCNHERLISSLENELSKYDELMAAVEADRARRKEEKAQTSNEDKSEEKPPDAEEVSEAEGSDSGSEWSSSSDEGAVYRLRARKQLPVSYRAQEYDRLISSAIKEEYMEPTTSAGNQGRGKDISTIIEAAEEEKLKAEREAIEQGKPIEIKKVKKKRRKARKLNSLEVPSEDDNETDEDFKDTGMESSSEDISTSADRESSNDSRSSDNLPIRRPCRSDKKERVKMTESSPEVKKKKKGVFNDTSDESSGAKEWHKKSKSKSKLHRKRDKSHFKKSRKGGLTQYDAEGNVIRARVTYGGLSDEGVNDWSPKHRTRQKKINYTEMPNTESEDEMHKSSGKHMPDSSDEFKLDDSEVTSDSELERVCKKEQSDHSGEERKKALNDLISKTAFVPLEKLPDDVTRAKTEELEAHLNESELSSDSERTRNKEQLEKLPDDVTRPKTEELELHLNAQAALNAKTTRGRGNRGGRGTRGPRRGGRGGARPAGPASDDALSKLVGVKIKELGQDGTPLKPNQAERDKKRQEREAKLAEKEAKRIERLQKKEEKEKLKEQKAKEREEKRQARVALQESKRLKKEKPDYVVGGPYMQPVRPLGDMPRMNMYPPGGIQVRHPGDFQEQRFPQTPRLQVRPELRGVPVTDERIAQLRADHPALREGTLSVAGSPQPFKPITEEPSIITRMPHMINQQYRGPMMYSPSNSPYGPRGQNMMYMHPSHHPSQTPPTRHQYPPQGYYSPHIRMPPGYPGTPMRPGGPHTTSASPSPGIHGPPGHHSPIVHRPGGPHPNSASPAPPGTHGPSASPHGPPRPHGPPGPSHGPPGAPPGSVIRRQPVNLIHGPPGQIPHGAISHGPGPRGPPGPIHGPLGPRAMPPNVPSVRPLINQPPPTTIGSMPRLPVSQLVPIPPGVQGPMPGPPVSPAGMPGPAHTGLPPQSNSSVPTISVPSIPITSVAPTDDDIPIKIKAEVKTEPEYGSPPGSPALRPPSPRDEPPRNHPKIKHTENKDRRHRYPLGPYAPQYGPYGPYAPPVTSQTPQEIHSSLLTLQSRLHAGATTHQTALPRMHPEMHQFLPTGIEKRAEPQSPLQRTSPHMERPLLHELSNYPYMQQHLRPQLRPPFMPLMRPPLDRTSPQYQQFDMHRSALEKQLATPAINQPIPQPVSREPTPPQPLRTTEENRNSTPPITTVPETNLSQDSGPSPTAEAKLPPQIVNKTDEPVKELADIKVENVEPREEGSVFGGLVSYFSSQREDDIDA